MQKIIVFIAIGVLTGCATSTSNYIPPVSEKFQNSRTIDRPFDDVWDRLVKELSSDFFVINNIDKASRLINISFSASRPSEYVNCGRTTRAFSNLRGKQDVDYDTADSANFAMATGREGVFYNVARTTKLDGRVNIYVAPETGGTNVTVNSKYVLGIVSYATAADGRPAGSKTYAIDFSTKVGSSQSEDGVVCFAKGNVESKILGFGGR